MRPAFVDTSVLVAIAFDEPPGRRVAAELTGQDILLAGGLLEAELRSALAREGLTRGAQELLGPLAWVHPDRRLTPEYDRVLAAGYLRGADLWHVACALFTAPDPSELRFVTLDERQGEVAAAVGFRR